MAKKKECGLHSCKRKTDLKKCKYCGEGFCKDHRVPQLVAMLREVQSSDYEYSETVRRSWNKPGHPDWKYTKKYWDDAENRRKEEERLFDENLNKMKTVPVKKADIYEVPAPSEDENWLTGTNVLIAIIVILIILQLLEYLK